MNRICFTLRVKISKLEEYKSHHTQVWPEMLEALTQSGWHNYSLFLAEDGLLVGCFETPGTLQEAIDALAKQPVNERWQTLMAPFFETSEGAQAHQALTQLTEVFHLK